MKAVICDDNPVFCASLKEMLEKEPGVESVSIYVHPDDLCQDLESGVIQCDVIFMDIDFRERQTGLNAAGIIYQINPGIQMIYITAYNDLYAQQVLLFDANLTGYISKPVDHGLLKKYLDKVQEKQNRKKNWIRFSVKGTPYVLLQDNVRIMESCRHTVIIRTAAEEYTVYAKLSEFIPDLTDNFIQCHKSFVVNANFIKQMTTAEIILDDGTCVPVSRAFRKSAQEAFFRHIARTARDN